MRPGGQAEMLRRVYVRRRGALRYRSGRCARQGRGPVPRLAAQPQVLHDLSMTVDFRGLEIVEQPAALSHHAQQATTRRVVALVHLEVLGQVMNLLGEEGDLDLGGPRVPLVLLELSDDALLLLL